MLTSPFDFERVRSLRGGRIVLREKELGAQPVAALGERVVTFKIPPSWASLNQRPLTHEEKYGWDPAEAKKEYGFGGIDGTPAFKGYFG